jgi:hypothetical protein
VAATLEEALAERVVQRAADPELPGGGRGRARRRDRERVEQVRDPLPAAERLAGREVGRNREHPGHAAGGGIDLAHVPVVVRLLGDEVRDVHLPVGPDREAARFRPRERHGFPHAQVGAEDDERARPLARHVELVARRVRDDAVRRAAKRQRDRWIADALRRVVGLVRDVDPGRRDRDRARVRADGDLVDPGIGQGVDARDRVRVRVHDPDRVVRGRELDRAAGGSQRVVAGQHQHDHEHEPTEHRAGRTVRYVGLSTANAPRKRKYASTRGQRAGGAVWRAGSIGLMSPTGLPSGSSTIA